jgi:hypothetical protein
VSTTGSKPPVPLRYWLLWWVLLVTADVVFYVLLTPVWMGLRAAAWTAEFRARRREGHWSARHD